MSFQLDELCMLTTTYKFKLTIYLTSEVGQPLCRREAKILKLLGIIMSCFDFVLRSSLNRYSDCSPTTSFYVVSCVTYPAGNTGTVTDKSMQVMTEEQRKTLYLSLLGFEFMPTAFIVLHLHFQCSELNPQVVTLPSC